MSEKPDDIPRKAVIEEVEAVRALRDFRSTMNTEMCSGSQMTTYGACIRILIEHWKVNPPSTAERFMWWENFKAKLGRPRKDGDPGGYLRPRTS